VVVSAGAIDLDIANPLAADRQTKTEMAVIIIFALMFFLAVQYSIKKGDRYLLPDFLLFDVLTVIVLNIFWQSRKRFGLPIVQLIVIAAVTWQVWQVFYLHPHELAYRNPFFRSVAINRTMGWGEGLDLAAHYLNNKPAAKEMLVVSYYEGQFDYKFDGEVTSAERLAKETERDIGADYVVLYRTMIGRAPDRWETKVLEMYQGKQPEKIININGEQYAWIYKAE